MGKSTAQRVLEMSAVISLLAFTLIVVVAPFIGCGCGHAHQTPALNNAKQLTFGLIQYAQDHDGRLPGWVVNAGMQPAHNAWDQQLDAYIKSKDVYFMPDAGPGIRSASDPERKRVVGYGLNGLLITPAKPIFDGRADFHQPPTPPRRITDVSSPAETILFASLVTKESMPNPFGLPPYPAPNAFGAVSTDSGARWREARDGWIDISPRDFVENTPPPSCYDETRWDASNGVARSLYGGGGVYAFVDGHVAFMKIVNTLGARDRVAPGSYWSPGNLANMWNPYR